MPTNKLVMDASAWIEYLEGTEKAKPIIKILESDTNEIFTPTTAIAEVISKFLRKSIDVKIAVASISNLSATIDIDQEISLLAGQIHAAAKQNNRDFGMLDAFVVASAKKLKAKIITADYDFKQFKEAMLF